MSELDVKEVPEPLSGFGCNHITPAGIEDMASAAIYPLEKATSDDSSGFSGLVVSEMDVLASDIYKMDMGEVPEPFAIEGKVKDDYGAAWSQDDKLMIYLMAWRDTEINRHTLISLNASSLPLVESEYKKVREHKSVVLRAKDVVWDKTVLPVCSQYVVCGATLYLVGGAIRGGSESKYGCSEMHLIKLEESCRSWTKGTSMRVDRGGHVAVSLNGKIYAFGGHHCYLFPVDLKNAPGAEVYDIEEDKWSDLEFPLELADDNSLLKLHCCVVDDIGDGKSQKILVYRGPNSYLVYDPNSDKWEDYYEKWRLDIDSSFIFHMLQSCRLLFFITRVGWWIFDLESKKKWGLAYGIYEIERALPTKDRAMPFEVVGLGCNRDDNGDMIHQFMVFYRDYDKGKYTIFVSRISMLEDRVQCMCVAIQMSLRFLVLDDFEPNYFYASIAPSNSNGKSVESPQTETETVKDAYF